MINLSYTRRCLRVINRGMAYVAVAMLAVMMLLSVVDVIGRYFGHPVLGTFEIVSNLLIPVTCFALAYTQEFKGHIGVDILVSRLPQRTAAIVSAISLSVSTGFMLVIIWQCTLLGTVMLQHHTVSQTLEFPLASVVYVLAFACAIMVLQLLADLSETLSKVIRK